MKVLFHQNCPTTITSLQSRVWWTFFLPRSLLLLSQESSIYLFYLFWLNQMDSRSLHPMSARSKTLGKPLSFSFLKSLVAALPPLQYSPGFCSSLSLSVSGWKARCTLLSCDSSWMQNYPFSMTCGVNHHLPATWCQSWQFSTIFTECPCVHHFPFLCCIQVWVANAIKPIYFNRVFFFFYIFRTCLMFRQC